MAMSAVALAQNKGGDEQGLEIPDATDLPADRDAIVNAVNGWWKEAQADVDKRLSWFNDAKFGCFIHWGPYSEQAGVWKGRMMDGYSEHLMRRATIPLDEYKREVVAPFNPVQFDAEEWMDYVAEGGMKYFIITAKHHDGFAMYPSDAYPYDIRMSSYEGDDFMMQLREVARRRGIKFGFYYSHAFDWEHPDAPGNDWDYDNPGGDKLLGTAKWWNTDYKSFLPRAERYVNEKSIPQILELIKRYDPDILWFDTPAKLPLYLNIRILEAIRSADPQHRIVLNGRLASVGSINFGDYRNTGDRAAFFPATEGPWESIPTTNNSYGYSMVDTIRKPASHFIRLLASAASKGGNILLNVGPMGNGRWDERDVEILRGVGQWMDVNGESLYGAERTDLPQQAWGVTTWRGDTLYAHVFNRPADGRLRIAGLRGDIVDARYLADKSLVAICKRVSADDCEIVLPKVLPDSINTVIALVVANRRPVTASRLLDTSLPNILYTFDATLHGSGLEYGDGKVNRNYVRNWKDNTQSMSWEMRSAAPAKYMLSLDYNTVRADDNGTVLIELGDKSWEVPYTGHPEGKGVKTLQIGEVELTSGTLECHLKGVSHSGSSYMNPIAVTLSPL